jgi:hypothetical protein
MKLVALALPLNWPIDPFEKFAPEIFMMTEEVPTKASEGEIE